MMELLDQLEAEHPDEAALAPKELAEYSCIYIKYLQIFNKLEVRGAGAAVYVHTSC